MRGFFCILREAQHLERRGNRFGAGLIPGWRARQPLRRRGSSPNPFFLSPSRFQSFGSAAAAASRRVFVSLRADTGQGHRRGPGESDRQAAKPEWASTSKRFPPGTEGLSPSVARPAWCTTRGCWKMGKSLTPPGTGISHSSL
ncbi:peptidyl-prolyl cis-trans isomerase FKBP1A isoform X1 [Anolis sagrei]|uniref:peptidyl-prolyl cis-trans isomerase FKBP1A isoform X1 n=1 Tax=Anolis sagrei TaxID=38937 RepID=UPI003521C19A